MRKRCRGVTTGWITVALTYFVTQWAMGQDRCADILTSGVHNTYQSIKKDNAKSQYKAALCDEASSLNTANPNGSLDVNVIDIVDIKAGGGNSTVSDLRRKYCTQNSGEMTDDDFQSIVRITIDPYIVENWRACMDSHGQGLYGNVDVNDKDIIFTLMWQGFAGVSSATVKDTPQVAGVTCPRRSIVSGQTLRDQVSVSQLCRRKGNGAVTFLVNTTAGSRTLKLSPIIKSSNPNVPAPAVKEYLPAAEPGVANLKVQVQRIDMGGQYHMRIIFTTPPVGGNVLAYNLIQVYGYQMKVGGRVDVPPSVFPMIPGHWAPGDVGSFEFDLPKQMSDPSQGWNVRFELGTAAAAWPSPNLLTGSPL